MGEGLGSQVQGVGAGKGVSTPGSTTPWGSGSPPLRAPGGARQGNAGRGLGLGSCCLPRPESARDKEPGALKKSGVYLALGVRGEWVPWAAERIPPSGIRWEGGRRESPHGSEVLGLGG